MNQRRWNLTRWPLLGMLALFTSFACKGTGDGAEVALATPRPITVAAPTLAADKPADYPGLHNVVAYTDGLYSGSQPEGPGLETLANMGIRTIVSVDGATPDVETAKALGIRYVHLPIGYDGIDEARKLELARACRDLPGPMYVHCHHGKHRSAGAAAAMAIGLGKLNSEQAAARMKVSGTAPDYKGLWACASDTRVASEEQLAAASASFPSRWKTTGLVQGMVSIDESLEHVKEIEKAQWKTPAAHPDLVPAAEVGRIAHVLRELEDDSEVKQKPADFLAMLKASTAAAEALEKGILDGASVADLGAKMKALNQSCKDCHGPYRN